MVCGVVRNGRVSRRVIPVRVCSMRAKLIIIWIVFMVPIAKEVIVWRVWVNMILVRW